MNSPFVVNVFTFNHLDKDGMDWMKRGDVLTLIPLDD